VHELSIATELHRCCRAEVGEDGSICEVVVAIGDLSGVEPELLRFAWEAVTAGGRDDGATLTIDWCPATQTCPLCAEIREPQPGKWLRLCPTCGMPLALSGGDELDLLRIEYQLQENEVTA